MRFRLFLALLALLALAVAAATPAADARKPRNAKRLIAFGSCDQLVEYAGRHMPAPPPRPAPAPTPGIPVSGGEDGEDTSGTNNQEAGVHEPDTIKTDGDTLFALTGTSLHAVDATGAGA